MILLWAHKLYTGSFHTISMHSTKVHSLLCKISIVCICNDDDTREGESEGASEGE